MNSVARFICVGLLLLSMLSGCLHQKKQDLPPAPPSNEYLMRFQTFSAQGLQAMQLEHWPVAELALTRAMNQAVLSTNSLAAVRAHYNLAVCYTRQSQWTKALDQLSRADIYLQEAHSSDAYLSDLIRVDLLRLQIQYRSGQQDKQVSYEVVRDLLISQESKYPADVWLAFGDMAHSKKEQNRARSAYHKVLKLSDERAEGAMLLRARAMLALAQLSMNDAQVKALNWSESALKVSRQQGLPRVAAGAWIVQGQLFEVLGEQQRIKAFDQAIQLYGELGDQAAVDQVRLMLNQSGLQSSSSN